MASDIDIMAREILKTRERLNALYVHHTGQVRSFPPSLPSSLSSLQFSHVYSRFIFSLPQPLPPFFATFLPQALDAIEKVRMERRTEERGARRQKMRQQNETSTCSPTDLVSVLPPFLPPSLPASPRSWTAIPFSIPPKP
jgi:hypothetical protein